MRLARLTAMTCLGFGLAASPALALTISYTTIPGDSLSDVQLSAFEAAAAAWEAVLIDPVTISVAIGFKDLGTATGGAVILGGAHPQEYSAPYSTMLKALITKDATSTTDASAVANLPGTVPNDRVVATAAELLALGISSSGLTYGNKVGNIEFTTEINFQYSRALDGTITSGYYDFLGIAEHEIGHILGFDSDVDSVDYSNYKTVLDLFRYTIPVNGVPGTPSFSTSQAACFSIDGGGSCVEGFSTGAVGDYQADHWLNNSGLLMQPVIAPGTTQNITPTDIQALDAIGWDVAVAEPGSLALLGSALAGMLALRRRRGSGAPVAAL